METHVFVCIRVFEVKYKHCNSVVNNNYNNLWSKKNIIYTYYLPIDS